MRTLYCSACDAEGTASCDCGVGYLSAGERASQAVAAHPEKGNRLLADETGIGIETIRRARIAGGSNGSPVKTIGRDGKAYSSTRKKSSKQNTPKDCLAEEDWLESITETV
jgi:hypothetical protein